jgi:hypothetical protein
MKIKNEKKETSSFIGNSRVNINDDKVDDMNDDENYDISFHENGMPAPPPNGPLVIDPSGNSD